MTEKRKTYLQVIGLIALATAVGFGAITTQSFWMDEGGTAFKALMPTLKSWWKMMIALGTSDMQMPAYLLQVWAWHQMGAISEFALRTANIPWLVITVLALRRVRFWPLVCLTSPFVLYYAGELRPYMMQIATGALAAAALGKVMTRQDGKDFTGLHALCGACLLLTVGSLTGAIWAAGVALGGVVIIRQDWLTKRGFWLRILPWIAGEGIIAAYYGYTVLEGYRAAAIGDAGFLNMMFGFYEMAGMLGIGPTRNELRDDPTSLIQSLWLVGPATLCLAGAWCLGLRSWATSVPRRHVIGVACATLLPVLILAVAGISQDFRVLGRHMSPAMPAVLLPIAAAFTARGSLRKTGAILAVVAVGFMLASSLQLRFSERHARDDYRQATKLGIDAMRQGKSVLWKADMNAARYYAYREGGVPYVAAIHVLEADPPTLMLADIVVINRPDLRFQNPDFRKDLEHNFFKRTHRFTGFEVWSSK